MLYILAQRSGELQTEYHVHEDEEEEDGKGAHVQLAGKSTFVRLQATLKWLAFSFTGRPSFPGAGRWGLFSERLCILERVCCQDYRLPVAHSPVPEKAQ